MRRDRTNAVRQARWRERQKQKINATVPTVSGANLFTPVAPAAPAVVVTSSSSHRYHNGLVPFVVALAALAVAAVSGSFSVIGLTAVFTGAFWPVVGMGAALECAKLSAVAWLGRRYEASRLLKASVTTLVVTLMLLSSIGSFGFLSKAHIASVAAGEATVSAHQAQIDARKEVAAGTVADLDKRIAQIDSAVDQATKRGRTSSAMSLVEHEAKRRNDLVAERTHAANALAAVEVQVAGVSNERAELAADYGPVKYLAALTGINADALMRWFVALVACLLDPAAVALLLAASTTE